ncbi:carbamoylphosphate synthase large subunit [Pholiota conissans]|uniref:Carbamoylphosphate synthase large subunit n=1 Tax=Pholiota conissans TaxID=109636 RepID=A0A9P6D1D8_9AGAR|nr:carbamoylphosphate synthase large subunit [Pholiota conissans]
MHYHVCKFSSKVKRSFYVPVPREDAAGFIAGVKDAIQDAKIDLIIPMHEEIFYLAEAAESDEQICSRLFCPPFGLLLRLHDKWEFAKFLKSHNFDFPYSVLCNTYEDILNLDRTKEWALKPVFGRAATNVFQLTPGKAVPPCGKDGIPIDEDNAFVAQEWVHGLQYCCYSVLQDGHVVALSIYPVQDTIDGSSCVFFESVEHAGIQSYINRFASVLPGISGQLAFDFIEHPTPNDPQSLTRLVVIECNPRATAGIHFWAGMPDLARVLTCRRSMRDPYSHLPAQALVKPGKRRQLAPGMLMWKRTKGESRQLAIKSYLRHMKHLMCSRDVIFSYKDIMPSLMQPFLLTSYYEICREKNLKLPTMFQYDLVWEPRGEYLRSINARLERSWEDDKPKETVD